MKRSGSEPDTGLELDDPQQMIDELKRQLAERTTELNEALAQQVATAKV